MYKIWVMLLCVNFVWCKLQEKNSRVKCDDCVPINECKEAAPYLNVTEENLPIINKSFCGIKNSTFNVCCSMFKDSINKTPHPNLKLLPDNCGNVFNGFQYRILNRVTESDLNEFPWMVPIFYYNRNVLSYKCPGTLINSRYVLTAAHCIHNIDIADVRVDDHPMNAIQIDCKGGDCATNTQDRQVEALIIHEDFNPLDNNANDIGLLRLAHNVDAGTICLPIIEELQNITITGRSATVVDWKKTEYNHESRLLLKEFVAVRSNKQCQKYYSYISPSDKKRFCAGRQWTNSCEEDSGAPLMLQEHYKGAVKVVQYGISSISETNCGSGMPRVYTNVRNYLKWILDNIRE